LRGIEEFASGNYRGLAREHLVQQAGMDFRIAIGAALFYNDEPIIGGGGVADCGKNHPAGRDPEQNQGVDILGAENHV